MVGTKIREIPTLTTGTSTINTVTMETARGGRCRREGETPRLRGGIPEVAVAIAAGTQAVRRNCWMLGGKDGGGKVKVKKFVFY